MSQIMCEEEKKRRWRRNRK